MKIVGNTVGTSLPKPNMLQDDPSKGDYVKGKENFPGHIPLGGKTGQYLRKKSDDDRDVEWSDLEIPKEYGLISYDQDRTITIT